MWQGEQGRSCCGRRGMWGTVRVRVRGVVGGCVIGWRRLIAGWVHGRGGGRGVCEAHSDYGYLFLLQWKATGLQ